MNQSNKITAIYLRISREDDRDGESFSIENQRTLLLDYAENNHFGNAQIFIDDGISGVTDKRKAFQEMLSLVKEDKVSTVLVKDMSRLGRNYLSVGEYVEYLFPTHDVRLIAVNDGVDTIDGVDDFMPFRNIMHEWYCKDIAHLAGVSRGTVDRVLNNRGSVNSETAKKVREIAKAVKYVPNTLGQKLAIKKKKLKFGFILFSSTTSNPFFEDVVAGINEKAEELKEYGASVEIRYSSLGSPDKQAQLIDELVDMGIDGLAITPINAPVVIKKIKSLSKKNIPVVTVNSDIPDCGRIAYVGSNYFKSGQTAGGLMDLVTGGVANIGVIIGSPLVLCHSERVAGFEDYIKNNPNNMKIIASVINDDEDLESYKQTSLLLKKNPEIDALFLAAAGVNGACKVVEELGLAGKTKIVSFDITKSTISLMQKRVISATIAQEPYLQGTKPLEILLDYVGMDLEPERELFHTKIEIKIKENL